jgi:hypothetical protein
MVYLYRLSKDVLAEKANFANEYNNKQAIEFIDKLLNREDNEIRRYLQTKDKEQQKKYAMIVKFYSQPKELQAIRQVFEQAIEGKAIKKRETIQRRNHAKKYTKQRSIQNLQAEDLKKKLLGKIDNN